jgi:hypothetical protein
MSDYEDYILEYFPDKDGNLETNKPRECRLCWIKNGYPPFEELAKICNSTLKTIQSYSSRFNWKSIRQKAEDLKAKAETEAQQKKQKEKLEKWDKVNEDLLGELQQQLKEVNDNLNSLGVSDGQAAFLRKEKREIIKEIRSLQPNSLRTVNLPDKINNLQVDAAVDAKIESEVTVNLLEKVKAKRRELNDLHND